MLPPPVLEIHLILLSLRAKFNFMSSCSNTNSRNKRVSYLWMDKRKAVHSVKSTKTRREARKEEVKAVFQSPCFVTRRRSALWRLHLSAILGTSSGQAANPSLLSGNNLSRRYLSSCQNLEGRNTLEFVWENDEHSPFLQGRESHLGVRNLWFCRHFSCRLRAGDLLSQHQQIVPLTSGVTSLNGLNIGICKVPAFMLKLCSKMSLLKVM